MSNKEKNVVFWKEWYQDHWNWLNSFYSMVISQNMVIVKILFILVTFQSGIMAFLISIHCCLEAHWSVQTKQIRENLWTAIPAVNSSRRFNKFVNDYVSRNSCRINWCRTLSGSVWLRKWSYQHVDLSWVILWRDPEVRCTLRWATPSRSCNVTRSEWFKYYPLPGHCNG